MVLSNDIKIKDLRDNYSVELLHQFYDDFLKPNFGLIEDELDPVSVWEELLEDQSGDVEGHVLLAFDEHNNIAGGNAFEFYTKSNCSLLSYFVVDDKHKQKGIVRALIDEAEKISNTSAKRIGKDYCDGIIIEMNKADPTLLEKGLDVLDPFERHKILYKLGFRILDFQYFQPPLSSEQNHYGGLYLAIRLTNNIQNTLNKKGEKIPFIEGNIIISFLLDFYISCDWREENEKKKNLLQNVDIYFKKQKEEIINEKNNKIKLLSLEKVYKKEKLKNIKPKL